MEDNDIALELEITNLKGQNAALTEENIKLRNHIEVYNKTNFNLLTSLVDQYSHLKDENIALKKENDKVKKDLTTATTRNKEDEKHIQMIIH